MYSGCCQRAQGQRLSGPRATLRGADVPCAASHSVAVDGMQAAELPQQRTPAQYPTPWDAE